MPQQTPVEGFGVMLFWIRIRGHVLVRLLYRIVAKHTVVISADTWSVGLRGCTGALRVLFWTVASKLENKKLFLSRIVR